MQRSCCLPCCSFGCCPGTNRSAAKLGRISAITETRPLESTRFSEKYVTYFTQPLDHRRPEKGSFRQRVIVSHVGFDRPTVIVTEGYGAAYALNPKYREELSELLDANMIFCGIPLFPGIHP